MKIQFIFAWYDFWVGLFYDREKNRLYFFPFPMLGIIFQFREPKIIPPYQEKEFDIIKLSSRKIVSGTEIEESQFPNDAIERAVFRVQNEILYEIFIHHLRIKRKDFFPNGLEFSSEIYIAKRKSR